MVLPYGQGSGTVTVLKNISIAVPKRLLTVICGSVANGKLSLLKIIFGETIYLGGVNCC